MSAIPGPGRITSPSLGNFLSSRIRAAWEHHPYYISLLRRFPHATIRRIGRKKCAGYSIIEPHVTAQFGLEIGGPSGIFGGNHIIPVYDRCAKIDGCDFSSRILWQGAANRRDFRSRLGNRFVAEASDLSGVSDGMYDFVLASHVMEHLANPLRALAEWKRVLRPEGTILVVLPQKETTFDRRRSITPFDHLEADFKAGTGEDDLTHLDEVLALHDLALDPGAGSGREFRERCLRNFESRAMHHHVFSPDLLVMMFRRLKMQVLHVSVERPFHIVGFAQKAEF